MADTARDPQALEREIERTRADLARTIDALVDRASPRNAARRGVQALKEEAGQRGPVVLIGAGVALAATAVVIAVWRRRRR